MNRSEIYKCYQLLEYLVSDYNYVSLSLMGMNTDNEIWLVDKDADEYQLIRISNLPYERTADDQKKLEAVMEMVKRRFFLKKVQLILIQWK